MIAFVCMFVVGWLFGAIAWLMNTPDSPLMLASGLLFLGAGALVAVDGSVIRAFTRGPKALDQSPLFQRISAVVVCLMLGGGTLFTYQGVYQF